MSQTMASISITRTCKRLEMSPAEACEEGNSQYITLKGRRVTTKDTLCYFLKPPMEKHYTQEW